jgi:glycosyltransferase involved in cell wall biosynthesis
MTTKIYLWIPNIFQYKGGVQVYSAFFVEAIQEVFPAIEIDVFLKHDTHCTDSFDFSSQIKFHFSGKCPSIFRTLFFSLQLLIHALINKPDLIICTHINFTILAYWLNKISKISYWGVAHGVDAWNIKKPMLITALQNADLILSVSHYTRDRLIQEQNFDHDQIVVLPNTFNHDRFTVGSKQEYLLDRYKLKANQPIILTIARLVGGERYKGYDQIIRALPEIIKVLPDVHYVIGGKGDDGIRVEALIKELDLEDCVTLAGFVPDEQLCDYYNLCNVFAMPSKGEGFGIVYLEALACGKPTIGGNQDGAIDALRNGELGVLVDPDDLTEISTVIIAILQKTYPLPILYQPETLRKKVIEIYGFEQFKQNLAELLSAHFKEVR